MRLLFFCVLSILVGSQVVFAQSETFDVRIFVGTDTVAPSTPTLLSVSPIAPTQIDVSWSAASDNYAVTGYSVSRNGSAIATTTLLSYADTGLIASTTYSYTVRAFDAALNYSSTSNSLSTTTLEIPPTPSSTINSRTEGTIARTVIDELLVEEGISTTSLFVRTAHSSRLEVRWGRTTSYELGYTVSDIYSNDHTTILTNLEPGTKYEYEIIGYTPYGFKSVIHTGSFVTKSNSSPVSPVNVSRFQAVGNGDDVDLSWQLPKDNSIAYVRIVRSHLGFPEHPEAGAVVYQGKGGSVKDIDILKRYSPVYYTAFVYDVFGNVSSGAVAIVYAIKSDLLSKEESPGVSSVVPVITEEATSSISIERVTVDMKMPRSSEILITQNEHTYSLYDKDIVLDSKQMFSLSIPSSAIAGNLKSIIVTLLDPTDNHKSYSFLMRINQNQTAYEATVAALGVVGRSQITVEIYDYEAFVVATYKAPITFNNLPEVSDNVVLFPDAAFDRSNWVFLTTVLIFLVLLVLFIASRLRGEDKR